MEFIKTHKVVLLIVGLIVVGVIIPLTVFLLSREQDTRSSASGAPVALAVTPATGSYALNSTIEIMVTLNTGANNVSGIDTKIEYDANRFNFISFTPSSEFTEVVNDSSVPGSVHFVGANVSTSKTITGNAVPLGTLMLSAKALGSGTVGFSNIQAVAQGGGGNILPLNTAAIVTGSYMVTNTTAQNSPTPTTSQIAEDPTPTVLPTFTITPTIPGVTITPTPTIAGVTLTPTHPPVGGTSLNFTVSLAGIGNNTSESQQLNNNPKRQTRSGEVLIYDGDLNLQDAYAINATYNPQSGTYTGNANLGNLPTGNYLVKLRLDNTLYKFIPGIQTINGGVNNIIAQPIRLTSGDVSRITSSDNLIDLSDYNAFLACLSQTVSTLQTTAIGDPNCGIQTGLKADLNDDDTVDSKDLNILLRAFAQRQGD